MAETFAINKIDFKRVLASFKVSDKNTEFILAQLDKMHRHINAIAFAEMLQKAGLHSEDVANVLRRTGIDDIAISNIMDAVEEERIKGAFGRIIELRLVDE